MLLRHDVDYSPEMAAELAEINAESGVTGTFFLLLRSPLYNLFDPAVEAAVRRIRSAEQEVAWHVACVPDQTSVRALEEGWQAFRLAVRDAAPLVAWHNPERDRLEEANRAARQTGLLSSVYDAPFMGAGVTYVSDSNLRHGLDDFARMLQPRELPLVQLLVHPLIWMAGEEGMGAVLGAAWERILARLDRDFSLNPHWRGR